MASTSTAPAVFQADPVFDVYSVLGATVAEVESQLGAPYESYEFDPGEMGELPDGGIGKAYLIDGYDTFVAYEDGIAVGVQIAYSRLEEDDYSADQWPELLARFGVTNIGEPDVTNEYVLRWNQHEGYAIRISVLDGAVWSLHVARQIP